MFIGFSLILNSFMEFLILKKKVEMPTKIGHKTWEWDIPDKILCSNESFFLCVFLWNYCELDFVEARQRRVFRE